jgi:hypothetical protein
MYKLAFFAAVLLGVSGQNAFADLVTLTYVTSVPIGQAIGNVPGVTVTQGFETFNFTNYGVAQSFLNVDLTGSPSGPFDLLQADGQLTITFSVPVTSISFSAEGAGATNDSVDADIADVYGQTYAQAGCPTFACGSLLGSAIGQADGAGEPETGVFNYSGAPIDAIVLVPADGFGNFSFQMAYLTVGDSNVSAPEPSLMGTIAVIVLAVFLFRWHRVRLERWTPRASVDHAFPQFRPNGQRSMSRR